MNQAQVQPSTQTENNPPRRVDVYGTPHRALRYLLSNLVVSMGRTSFGDPMEVEAVLGELASALSACESHIAHEDAHLRPALEQRAPSTVAEIDREHAAHAEQVEQLRALAASLRHAQTRERRIELGRTLTLHFSVFVAETFAHAAHEERVVQPLLDRLFSSEELETIHSAVLASIPPHEMMVWLRWIVPSATREERTALLAQVQANAPPDAFAALMSDLRKALGSAVV
jgi:hemerythrin-like domain-containing protein